jgi:hypothetical protein
VVLLTLSTTVQNAFIGVGKALARERIEALTETPQVRRIYTGMAGRWKKPWQKTAADAPQAVTGVVAPAAGSTAAAATGVVVPAVVVSTAPAAATAITGARPARR